MCSACLFLCIICVKSTINLLQYSIYSSLCQLGTQANLTYEQIVNLRMCFQNRTRLHVGNLLQSCLSSIQVLGSEHIKNVYKVPVLKLPKCVGENYVNKAEQKNAIHAAAAKSLQSCPTLCDPTEGSPPGSPIPGILQARTLEWVAISFSSA